ncbi:MAG TPA: type II toxin-antitoxin system HicB family antitoxin [Caulobacteraceae bacterium]|jgi:predicted RNase H-like HicB family nuclease
MNKRWYPAVLERGEGGVFGVWFPDFPGCVAAGKTQEEAAAKAEEALARALETAAEVGSPLPVPSPYDAIAVPKEAEVVAFLSLGAAPPDPSERVNIYLPKSLITRADDLASRWGMSRSSLFGLAMSRLVVSPWAVVPSAIGPSELFVPSAQSESKRRKR